MASLALSRVNLGLFLSSIKGDTALDATIFLSRKQAVLRVPPFVVSGSQTCLFSHIYTPLDCRVPSGALALPE